MEQTMADAIGKFFFSNGRFWWTNYDGHKLLMRVRQFNGYPVVHSSGYNWGTENGRDYFVVGSLNGHYYRLQHLHLHMRLHLAHRAYPVVIEKGKYYGTNNGRTYRKVFFSHGQFWWRDHDSHRIVMHVRRFKGYPVVYSNGHYWGTDNGRDYFAVDHLKGRYYLNQHVHLRMRLHLARPGNARMGRQFQDHTLPVV